MLVLRVCFCWFNCLTNFDPSPNAHSMFTLQMFSPQVIHLVSENPQIIYPGNGKSSKKYPLNKFLAEKCWKCGFPARKISRGSWRCNFCNQGMTHIYMRYPQLNAGYLSIYIYMYIHIYLYSIIYLYNIIYLYSIILVGFVWDKKWWWI